ncbi:MAG: transcriptional regulator, partial [Clostridia bacterium]|nr:transcriptional regulator [Clostridia bacterium]
PDIDSYLGLMHTLFALEDLYGLTIENRDGGCFLRFDPAAGKDAEMISEMVKAWGAIAERYRAGEIDKEKYDQWRYRYPEFDQTQGFVKIPSKQLSDALLDNE